MDTQTNPLLQLEPDKQQQLVDLVENGDIETVADATGMSRRQVLMAAAALGVGALGGGMTAREFIQQAEAAASTSDSDGNVGLPGDRVDVFADGVDSNSVNTEGADITNETFIIPTLSSDITGKSSGVWTNPFDGESQDNRGEYNASQEFVPDESGWYDISIHVVINPGSDQDRLQARIQDVDNGTTIGETKVNFGRTHAGQSNWHALTGTHSFNLTSGTSYEIQVRDSQSSYDVESKPTTAYIRRAVVHP